ncbi:hypothetical protein [Salinibacter ruber]|uniref:hypothetical protein n=1 Tax=Salinibacter ruber TaxID=146919 RepID=UPI00207391B4|nr:hypothetical protein [Salinibacter ruber]
MATRRKDLEEQIKGEFGRTQSGSGDRPGTDGDASRLSGTQLNRGTKREARGNDSPTLDPGTTSDGKMDE